MLQETPMAGWEGLEGFEEIPVPEPGRSAGPPWVEPYPGDLLGGLADSAQGPLARYTPRESISLAFVAALQHLPPRRRAAFVLCDVVGFSAAEAAEILECGTEAVETALAGTRAVLDARLPPGRCDRSPLPGSARECAVASRFAEAFERGDTDGIAALLTEDAWVTAPPVPFGYRGRAAAEFLTAVPFRGGTRRVRLIATRANGQPAFGYYIAEPTAPVFHAHGISRAHGLIVLTLDGDRVSGITRFMDESVLRLFRLPRTLPD
jgi:RNA polymerase sigma-70 factor, ECF subfamily